MQAKEIQTLIEQALPACRVQVSSEDGHHFQATVISDAFLGKSRVQQQQLVYSALGNLITGGSLHALSLKTYTPEDWQTLNANLSS